MRLLLAALLTSGLAGSAWAENLTEAAASPPAYGNAPVSPFSGPIRVRPVLGAYIGVVKPLGDFSDAANAGFEVALRGGVELNLNGLEITPDGTLNFARAGASDLAQADGLDSFVLIGFMFGARIGYHIANVATPYFTLHLGVDHNIGNGPLCDQTNVECSNTKFGMNLGFGADFWLSDNVALGPIVLFNFDFTDQVSSNFLTFGLNLTFRLGS
jgi:opacity protein-like surface antigen